MNAVINHEQSKEGEIEKELEKILMYVEFVCLFVHVPSYCMHSYLYNEPFYNSLPPSPAISQATKKERKR